MTKLAEALAWRWRRWTRPARWAVRRLRLAARRLQEARLRRDFRGELAALSAPARRGASPQAPRVLAIGAWSFPLHSQSFVYQELAALAAAGFDLRLAVSSIERRAPPSPSAATLASRLLSLPGAAAVGAEALRDFRARRRPAVANVVAEIADGARRPAEEVERDPHVLRAFAFARLAEAWGADYLHSYFFYEGALAAFVAQRLLDLPRGLTAYADHCLHDYRFKLVREQLEAADLVVATSERVRGELLAVAP